MAIAALILGLLAIGAAITYFALMVALALLGLILFSGIYLVGFSYSYGGPGAAIFTGLAYVVLVRLVYSHHIEEQKKAEEEQRRQKEERIACDIVEKERSKQEALKKPWHDRSAKDWGRVLF